MFHTLIPYGWNDYFQEEYTSSKNTDLNIGRVLSEHRTDFTIMTIHGLKRAVISGKLRHDARTRADLPAVGDWVLVNLETTTPQIELILPRQSCFSRKTVGENPREQIMGANVDTLFIMTALNGEFNERRLERYLTVALSSGAEVVVVLNKADLCDNPDKFKQMVQNLVADIPICVISAEHKEGIGSLTPYLRLGKTLALIGSSGVGKSTLLNTLAGQKLQKVQLIRESDSKGKHTTTHRELFLLPNKQGLVLDSPGIREIQLWESQIGLESTFQDVLTLISECRFKDCSHEHEPFCAVQEALNSGLLLRKRYASFLKLSDEKTYNQKKRLEQQTIQKRIKTKRAYKRRRERMLGLA